MRNSSAAESPVEDPASLIASAGSLRLIHCSSPRELEIARTLRNEMFLRRRNISFDQQDERRRDTRSNVFLLLRGDAPVATVRSQPYPSAVSVLSAVPEVRARGVNSEVGRVAAVPSGRHAEQALLVLVLGAMWSLGRTTQTTYAAHCHPALTRLYQVLGAEVTGATCQIPGRDVPHAVLVGTYEDTVRLGLETLGMSPAQAQALIRWDLDEPAAELSGLDRAASA